MNSELQNSTEPSRPVCDQSWAKLPESAPKPGTCYHFNAARAKTILRVVCTVPRLHRSQRHPQQVQSAREALDRVGARSRRMAFRSGDRLLPSGSTTPRSSDGIRASASEASTTSGSSISFEDEWLRGGPVQRWVPRGLAGKPVFVFETGGTTGVPKTRINCEDFRIDYEIFSTTLPDEHFPKGGELADARAVGPAPPAAGRRAPDAAPRRHLRSASISIRDG